MGTCVLLPSLNEAGSIAGLVRRIRKTSPGYGVYVVDSGSTDGTQDIARRDGARVITLREKGKARAVRKAFAEIDADRIVLLDSDGSYAPEDIPALLKALGDCPVAVGNRFGGKMRAGAMGAVHAFGNRLLTLLANILYGKRIGDVCSGFWAFRRDAYKNIRINSDHFELEANFYVECARKRIDICEVPVSYGKRRGKSKLGIFDGFGIGTYLIKERFC